MKPNILTGQQIGLLGGPLYTTYKVLGAVHRAQAQAGQAIYWLETNDADFNEINHVEFLDSAGTLQSLHWEKDTGGYSCGYIEVDENLRDILRRFFDALAQTEFTEALRNLALDAYHRSATLAEASLRLAESLFSEFPLTIFNPQDKEFRRRTRPVLMKEMEATPIGEQCNAFVMVDKKRVAIFRSTDGYVDRSGRSVDVKNRDLVPNVHTRNLIQDCYFHTHTYIAGPAELKYIAELDGMYDSHGVRKPNIEPRMSVLLLEPRIRRHLRKLDITVEDIRGHSRDQFLHRIQSRLAGKDYNQLQRELVAKTENLLEDIAETGIEIGSLRPRWVQEIKAAVGKRRAQEKKETAAQLTKAALTYDSIRPFGRPQERVFNIFYFMNYYGGLNFIRWLYDRYNRETDILEVDHG